MPLQDCFDKLAEWAGYSTQITRDIDPSAIAFKEVSDPERLCPTPLVSVLMRAYNAEKTISRAIESIVTQQTDFPFELVIADDASTDDTVAVCKEWLAKHPDKIRILRACKNSGNSVNDVLTHSQARGKWIAECDSDDYWLETCKLQRQMDLIRKHNAVLCVTDYVCRDINDGRLFMFPLPKTEVITPQQLANTIFQTSTFLYSKEAYTRMVHEVPIDFQGDTPKENGLACYGKIVCLHDVASVWFRGGGVYSSLSRMKKEFRCILTFFRLFCHGHRTARRAYGIHMLAHMRQALHPKQGLTAQEWQELCPFILPLAKHVFWRLLPSPKAIALYLKIRSRAKHLRNA